MTTTQKEETKQTLQDIHHHMKKNGGHLKGKGNGMVRWEEDKTILNKDDLKPSAIDLVEEWGLNSPSFFSNTRRVDISDYAQQQHGAGESKIMQVDNHKPVKVDELVLGVSVVRWGR